jgi:hypothetical protein
MKKTKHIELILITAALASCHRPGNDWQNGNKLYVRGDSTAPYSRAYHYHPSPVLWYYAFRPYGNWYNGYYQRAGYYSGAISEASNIGSNGYKGSVVRGGFGRGSFSVSS